MFEKPNPEMDVLMKMRGQGMPEGNPDKMNPASQNTEGSELFLDRKLFQGGKVKEGQPITVTGTVTSVGDKIGFSPMACAPAAESAEGGEGSADSESKGDEYDEDLHDSVD